MTLYRSNKRRTELLDITSVRITDFQTPAYLAAVELRREVLRKPLGLDFEPAELANEGDSFHLVAELEGKVVGCLVIQPVDINSKPGAKIRQVAVSPELQGYGLGRKMMAFAEDWCVENRMPNIILNSRESVCPFYAAIGYTIEGERFFEVGIPHYRMLKHLS